MKLRQAVSGVLLFVFLNGCGPIASTVERPTETVTATVSPSPQPSSPNNLVETQLAWFYKPPLDEDEFFMLAHEFDFFILTRGDEIERDQLLMLGARQPILQYLRFDTIHALEDCEARPRRNQAAYRGGDYCAISRDHPDWFLLNREGERIYQLFEDQTYVMMDREAQVGALSFWNASAIASPIPTGRRLPR